MAFHFSANQFEAPYNARLLQNWELSKWYPPHPRTHKKPTEIIANDRGHLLDTSKRDPTTVWSNFRSTYELPKKITRNFANEYNKCLIGKYKWKHFPRRLPLCPEDEKQFERPICSNKCAILNEIFKPPEKIEKQRRIRCKKQVDLEYVPGDFTPAQQQHSTRDLLLQQKYERDHNIEPELPLNKLYLGDEFCQYEKLHYQVDDLRRVLPPAPFVEATQLLRLPKLHAAPHITTSNQDSLIAAIPPQPETSMMPQTTAFTNINDSVTPSLDYFKQKFPLNEDQMATLNLAQPNMPLHSITEKPNERNPSPVIPAYANFEQAKRMHHDNLDHQPLPDCVADVAFRKHQLIGAQPGLALDIDPIATGVGVKAHNIGPTHCTKMRVFRPRTCGVVPKAYSGNLACGITQQNTKPMTPIDLAIQWDYRPENPADEPQPPPHIDGSAETAGPAVFNYVKTPRDDTTTDLGRSAGVFNSTLGESNFFDKDIMRRKTNFGGQNTTTEDNCDCGPPNTGCVRACSVTRGSALPTNRLNKQYRSAPNIVDDEEYRGLRAKYLGEKSDSVHCHDALNVERGCRRSKGFSGACNFLRRARSRLCHKVAPEPPRACCTTEFSAPCRRMPPFRAGVPKFNAAGHFVSADSGCSMGSCHGSRVLVVPRPRDPYAKRNYNIETLVPPFRSYCGGAGEGGYPEHWRLSSVYQHSYKPLEQRRRPLLQTVYK